MTLKLKRPLAIFDLETTGVNVASDRIVELCVLKAYPDGAEELRTLRINPEMPIPYESSVVHGIYDEDVANAPTFKEIAAELAEFLGDADLGGYNSNKFDIPLLMEEFLRANTDFSIANRFFVDVQNIFHQMEQRTLKAAYKFYCDKELVNAHSAEADVRATFEVLKAQVQRYEGQEWADKSGNVSVPVVNDIEALHKFTNLNRTVDFAGRLVYNSDNIEVFSFGKHKGKAVVDVFKIEPSYYSWMMRGDFPMYTKKCLEQIWNRCRQAPKSEGEQHAAQPASSNNTQRPQPQASTRSSGELDRDTGKGTSRANEPTTNYRKDHKRSQKPSKPITPDMLKNLQDRFKK